MKYWLSVPVGELRLGEAVEVRGLFRRVDAPAVFLVWEESVYEPVRCVEWIFFGRYCGHFTVVDDRSSFSTDVGGSEGSVTSLAGSGS